MSDDTEDGLPKAYEPAEVEARWYRRWERAGAFRAEATSRKPPFCIILPPPNVTGSLHIGHALTATLEDILIRWHRMRGFNTLWQPGVDHAGIATQLVVERELQKSEHKSRHDLGREEFVAAHLGLEGALRRRGSRSSTSTSGPASTGAATRFTMDQGSSRAVLEVFVRLYEEGLIYRAARLINWCPDCRTALSDLEVEHEERLGSIWDDPLPGEGPGPLPHRRHHPARDDARRHRGRGSPRRPALQGPDRQERHPSVARAGDPDHRRRRRWWTRSSAPAW